MPAHTSVPVVHSEPSAEVRAPCSTRSAPLSLAGLLNTGRITSSYQPIVDLDSGSIVAYEALARGPAGTDLASPDVMFDESPDD